MTITTILGLRSRLYYNVPGLCTSFCILFQGPTFSVAITSSAQPYFNRSSISHCLLDLGAFGATQLFCKMPDNVGLSDILQSWDEFTLQPLTKGPMILAGALTDGSSGLWSKVDPASSCKDVFFFLCVNQAAEQKKFANILLLSKLLPTKICSPGQISLQQLLLQYYFTFLPFLLCSQILVLINWNLFWKHSFVITSFSGNTSYL